ncbi:MAG: metallophosphoesterase [Candidatus Thorarchaeota archaeon]
MSYIHPVEKIGGKSFLVNPNLGHPLILSIDPELKNDNFEINLLYISNIEDPKKFEKYITKKIKLIPILEYKWKLKLILEKIRKEIELKKKEKKKSFWQRWKERRSSKKKKKLKTSETESKTLQSDFIEIELEDERLRRLKPRAFRGDPIIPTIWQVENASITAINDLNYEEYCSPHDHLLKHNIYSNLDIFFKVTIRFDLTEEVLEFLRRRKFVMFDIVQKIDNYKNRINYHSIVISKQDWEHFTFIHATDLHIAERNDKIYEIIKKWTKLFSGDYLNAITKEKDFKIERVDEKESLKDDGIHKPLKKRFVNPNNQFRRFIKIMNRKVLQNELDFIALTGDLIDFSLLSKFPKELKMFDYNHSNWKTFKEIVLNLPQKKRKGNVKGEELLCPIFTIPGNHDYRPFHYDIRWAGLYRKMGLKASEALALNDKLLALPVSAIIKSKKSLKGYWSEINPSLDYFLKFGKSNFIFLNTGSDSFKNLSDLITGHPSLTGLKKKQISYLENLINNKIQQGDNTFLFLHGPVINPKKKIGLFKRIKHKFGKRISTKIDEFRESLLKKFGKKTSKIRIDKKFNVKYGTVSSNWEKLVKFCKDYCVLTMTGHTHTLKEFRLGDPENKKSRVFDAPPFSLKKIENPAAIFFDTYSEVFTNAKDIEKFGPFVVQTPALGLAGYRSPRLVGAYREIKIKHGKLSSFKVKYIHR